MKRASKRGRTYSGTLPKTKSKDSGVGGKKGRNTTMGKKDKESPWGDFGRQAGSIILFGVSVLMLFMVFIKGESVWLSIHNFILGLFGICSILWPVLLLYISILGALGKNEGHMKIKIWLSCLSIILFCSLIYVFENKSAPQTSSFFEHMRQLYMVGAGNGGAGLVGGALGVPLTWLFGISGARVINSVLLFAVLMLLTGTSLIQFLKAFIYPLKAAKRKADQRKSNVSEKNPLDFVSRKGKIDIEIGSKRNSQDNDESLKYDCNEALEELKKATNGNGPDNVGKSSTGPGDKKYNDDLQDEAYGIAQAADKLIKKMKSEGEGGSGKRDPTGFIPPMLSPDENKANTGYRYPPADLLNESEKKSENDITSELKTNGHMLVETLKSFNVQTKIVDISRGPAVTRYELQPAAGVKISKITSLSDDIALNLAAAGVRIEAPIPGKAAVGVEIPNRVVNVVSMRELIDSRVFSLAKSKLTVVLGRDISGNVMVADLGKMPHILIAGSTGSGKSVCINSFIISLLYKAAPDEVKLLMVDPKVVELGIYNGIPHLLVPVVTDPRKAAGALNWAVNEMLNRYRIFAENNVRDISSYNSYVDSNKGAVDGEGNPLERMARIVIIIDELSDLMMAAPNDVEDYICRLAQMARAAGMHLVIATQRPSVDVITGIIKANIPSRIALAVSSQVDSRTILDMSGAEKLLGRGDMLFSPVGSAKPIRVQGCYVTDVEIERVISFVKKSQGEEYSQDVIEEIEKNAVREKDKSSDSQDSGSDDPVMREAIRCVVEAGQASTSLLQRRLRVGYARAGRLIDEMEQMGIVGPHEGSKPRQVLITHQQLIEREMRESD